MQCNDIISRLSARKQKLREFGVRTLGLFGSTARNEARTDSDIDFLVEFDGVVTFDKYMDLKFFLEDLLEHRVDLVTRNSLKPLLKPYIEKDMVYVT